MCRSLPAALIATVILSGSVYAKDAQPLKVIAPDLIVETAEYGAFVSKGGVTKFVPTTTIGRPGLGEYGWRLKLKTTRDSVHWSETGDNGPKLVHVFTSKPEHGYIEHHLDWVNGIKGKFAITVNVENVPVKTFTVTAQ
jgi:hypothetical protein